MPDRPMFGEVRNPVERVQYLFAWELAFACLLVVLLPGFQAARGSNSQVLYIESLRYLLPSLVGIIALCLSVLRNCNRSPLARLAAGVGLFCFVPFALSPVLTVLKLTILT